MGDWEHESYNLPSKLELEKTVGNTNKLNPELLKPKYASNCEMGKVLDERGKIIPPHVVICNTKERLDRQVPIMIASFRYLNRTGFTQKAGSVHYDKIQDPYFAEFIFLHERYMKRNYYKAITKISRTLKEIDLCFRNIPYLRGP